MLTYCLVSLQRGKTLNVVCLNRFQPRHVLTEEVFVKAHVCASMFNIPALFTKCICVEDTARGHLPRMELKPEVKRPFKGGKEVQ